MSQQSRRLPQIAIYSRLCIDLNQLIHIRCKHNIRHKNKNTPIFIWFPCYPLPNLREATFLVILWWLQNYLIILRKEQNNTSTATFTSLWESYLSNVNTCEYISHSRPRCINTLTQIFLDQQLSTTERSIWFHTVWKHDKAIIIPTLLFWTTAKHHMNQGWIRASHTA